MFDKDLVPAVGPATGHALLAVIRPLAWGTLISLLVGAAAGWFYKWSILSLLTDPWRDPNRIIENVPDPERVLQCCLLVPASAEAVLALPFLTLLMWATFAPRFLAARRGFVISFVRSSYIAIAVGLSLIAFVAFPAFRAWAGAESGNPTALVRAQTRAEKATAFRPHFGATREARAASHGPVLVG